MHAGLTRAADHGCRAMRDASVPRGSRPARRTAHRARARVGARAGARAQSRTRCSCWPAGRASPRWTAFRRSPAPSARCCAAHVVLVDQRGTGESQPADCASATDEARQSKPTRPAAAGGCARAGRSAASNGSTPTRASTRPATRRRPRATCARRSARRRSTWSAISLWHARRAASTCVRHPAARRAPSCSTASCRPRSRSARSTRATWRRRSVRSSRAATRMPSCTRRCGAPRDRRWRSCMDELRRERRRWSVSRSADNGERARGRTDRASAWPAWCACTPMRRSSPRCCRCCIARRRGRSIPNA